MTEVTAKLIEVQASYSPRRFSLSGSLIDKSVLETTEKAGGYWEPHIMNLMARAISANDVCLDIGANIGVHTLVMADLAPKGTIHAFEASSVNFGFLQANVAANKFANIVAHNVGLGNASEEKNFYYLSDFPACSFAEDTRRTEAPETIIQSAWNGSLHYVAEKVAFTTLDLWSRSADLKRLDFIKLDVEGSELAVIRGGEELFSRFQPDLITELNTNAFQNYFREDPQTYFDLLLKKFASISVIHEDGQLTPVRSYGDLGAHFGAHWWVDLFCTNRR